MKVGFSGTQHGMSDEQRKQFVRVLDTLNPSEFHHGDCIGADAQAHDLVRSMYPWVQIVVHPPIDTDKRAFKRGDEEWTPLPYLLRNKEIVAATEVLIAAPRTHAELKRSGTWSTVRQARWLGRPIHLLLPSTVAQPT